LSLRKHHGPPFVEHELSLERGQRPLDIQDVRKEVEEGLLTSPQAYCALLTRGGEGVGKVEG
jgi:hypothetical protein